MGGCDVARRGDSSCVSCLRVQSSSCPLCCVAQLVSSRALWVSVVPAVRPPVRFACKTVSTLATCQTSPTLVLLVETSGPPHMQPCVAPAIEPGVGGAYRTRGRVRREAERRVSSLLDLPTDALRLIVSHLPIHAFCQAGATCTHLRDACCDTSRKQATPTQPVYLAVTPFYQMGVPSPPQRRACKPKP